MEWGLSAQLCSDHNLEEKCALSPRWLPAEPRWTREMRPLATLESLPVGESMVLFCEATLHVRMNQDARTFGSFPWAEASFPRSELRVTDWAPRARDSEDSYNYEKDAKSPTRTQVEILHTHTIPLESTTEDIKVQLTLWYQLTECWGAGRAYYRLAVWKAALNWTRGGIPALIFTSNHRIECILLVTSGARGGDVVQQFYLGRAQSVRTLTELGRREYQWKAAQRLSFPGMSPRVASARDRRELERAAHTLRAIKSARGGAPLMPLPEDLPDCDGNHDFPRRLPIHAPTGHTLVLRVVNMAYNPPRSLETRIYVAPSTNPQNGLQSYRLLCHLSPLLSARVSLSTVDGRSLCVYSVSLAANQYTRALEMRF